jgi:hypothetical protein
MLLPAAEAAMFAPALWAAMLATLGMLPIRTTRRRAAMVIILFTTTASVIALLARIRITFASARAITLVLPEIAAVLIGFTLVFALARRLAQIALVVAHFAAVARQFAPASLVPAVLTPILTVLA